MNLLRVTRRDFAWRCRIGAHEVPTKCPRSAHKVYKNQTTKRTNVESFQTQLTSMLKCATHMPRSRKSLGKVRGDLQEVGPGSAGLGPDLEQFISSQKSIIENLDQKLTQAGRA